jgi:hypothetical protein
MNEKEITPDEFREYLTDIKPKRIQRINLGSFISPIYSKCDYCPFVETCEEFVEHADCAIEKEMIQFIYQSLAETNLTDIERLSVFPLIQSFTKLMKLYSLEQRINLRDFLIKGNVNPLREDEFNLFKNTSIMINSEQKVFLGLLKALRMTNVNRKTSSKMVSETFYDLMNQIKDDEEEDLK